MVERRAVNADVTGSNPVLGAKNVKNKIKKDIFHDYIDKTVNICYTHSVWQKR